MNKKELRTATLDELKSEYERLRLLISDTKKNWRTPVVKRELIVKEIRRRKLNPHDVL